MPPAVDQRLQLDRAGRLGRRIGTRKADPWVRGSASFVEDAAGDLFDLFHGQGLCFGVGGRFSQQAAHERRDGDLGFGRAVAQLGIEVLVDTQVQGNVQGRVAFGDLDFGGFCFLVGLFGPDRVDLVGDPLGVLAAGCHGRSCSS